MPIPAPVLTDADLEAMYNVALLQQQGQVIDKAVRDNRMFRLATTMASLGRPPTDTNAFVATTFLEQFKTLATLGSSREYPAVANFTRFMERKTGSSPTVDSPAIAAIEEPPAVSPAPPNNLAPVVEAATPAAATPVAPAAKRTRKKGVEVSDEVTQAQVEAYQPAQGNELSGRVYTAVLKTGEDLDVLKKEMAARLTKLEAALAPKLEALERTNEGGKEDIAELRALMLMLLEHLLGLPESVALSEARQRAGLPVV